MICLDEIRRPTSKVSISPSQQAQNQKPKNVSAIMPETLLSVIQKTPASLHTVSFLVHIPPDSFLLKIQDDYSPDESATALTPPPSSEKRG